MAEALFVEVWTKERKMAGVVYPSVRTEFDVEVVIGQSISIFKAGKLCNVFAVGEQAEHGSYNLSYYGEIVGIGSKAVTIKKGKGYGEKCRVLDFSEFCRRNWDFDLEVVSKKNAEEMMYL